MNTFLQAVATNLIEKYGNDLAHKAIVFPNKRAALFLNQELAKHANGPIWSPSYVTISELFQQQSSLTIADPIKSLCILYKVYMEQTGRNETLDEFYGWGQLLLADFDDIDKNMADAEKVFRNIRDLHELDTIDYLSDSQKAELSRFFANFTGDSSILKDRFLRLWSKLYNIYSEFKTRLRKENLAYEGMLYRDVIEQKQLPNRYDTYIFVGFNVLQKVEQKLFSALKSEGKARFYWDYDHYYMAQSNEAGVYINKWLRDFPNEFAADNPLYTGFEAAKEVRYVSAPTENLQARYVSEWLLENQRYKAGRHTAVVMCNEMLLQTVIHCIPPEVDTLNVTTGYPLSQTPISSMVWQLIALQTEGFSAQEGAYRLQQLAHVLRHPYGKYLGIDANNLLAELQTEKQYYIKVERTRLKHVDKPVEALVEWLVEMVRAIATNGAENHNQLFQESTFRMYTLLNKLLELMKEGDLMADFVMFRRLFSQLIASTSIPFHGEPARGVQVMGVLETRNLDFENVLLLSCNEGNMPKGVSDVSFIPHFVRKAYGLTTIDNKVSVFSYYFHRLLQRAKNVTLLYNNSTEGTRVGEMSRFMLQLLVESKLNIKQWALQAGQEPLRLQKQTICKDETVLKKLNSISYFSPTAINTYQRCPVMFYYKYVAELLESNDNDTDDIDGRVFGNIFHCAAQLMYEQLLPREVIKSSDIEQLLSTGRSVQSPTSGNANATLDSVVSEAFARELYLQKPGNTRHPKLNGLQIIKKEVIVKFLRHLLQIDLHTSPMRVIRHEFDIYKRFTINVGGKQKTITVGGRVDRLDEIKLNTPQEQLRVVDYKTGNKVAGELKKVEDIFNPAKILNEKNDYIFQAILYSIIEQTEDNTNNPNHKPVSPALLFIQHANRENYSPVVVLEGAPVTNAATYENDFENFLKEKLEELFNSETFIPTTNQKICENCPYNQLCGQK